MAKSADPVDELRRTGQALPRTVTPLPNETVGSYIHRLAEANLLDSEALRNAITGDSRRRAELRIPVLARLSGVSEDTLRRALPELRPRDEERWPAQIEGPGCTLCCAARGVTRPVRVWRRSEQVLCRRHNRWITGDLNSWYGHEQPNLTDQHEILKAHRLHLRLIRKHGRPATASAFARAAWIINEWHESGAYDYALTEGFDQRVSIFLGSKWRRLMLDSAIAVAARYPQRVALTRLLVSPFWRELALGEHIRASRPRPEDRQAVANAIYEYRRATVAWADTPAHLAQALNSTYLLQDGPNLRKFLDELRRTVEPRYVWNPFPDKHLWLDLRGTGKYDPLVDWMEDKIHEQLHPGQPRWEYIAELVTSGAAEVRTR